MLALRRGPACRVLSVSNPGSGLTFSDCPLDRPASLKKSTCKERVMPVEDDLILEK